MENSSRKQIIDVLKQIRNKRVEDNFALIPINDENLITKGILYDNEHTCYHSFNCLEDMIESLVVSANNYGIYLCSEFIGIVSVFNHYYKDLTRLELSICIKEEYRNMNIGNFCYKFIIKNYFKSDEVKSIHLTIREDNIKSRKLAEKNGFKLYTGYKADNYFTKFDGSKVKQVQYLLKKKDYMKNNTTLN